MVSLNEAIKPSDIDTTQHFWDSFGNTETEVSANYIVRFLQKNDNLWRSFTRDEIEAFYNNFGHTRFSFNKLITSGMLYQKDDLFTVTREFIFRCYKSSPANKE